MPYYRKKYHVIYADPPWKDTMSNFKIQTSCAAFINQIRNKDLLTVNVGDICHDDCVLYLWITGPRINFGCELMKAWGFKYGTVAYVWKKGNMKLRGFYSMSQCEYVLAGGRKRTPKRAEVWNEPQFRDVPRREIMQKPIEIIESIDRIFPWGNRIELFARSRHSKKWDILGDQLGDEDTDYYLKPIDGKLIITKKV